MNLTPKEKELILFLRDLEENYKPWEETKLWKNKAGFMTWVRGKLRGGIWSRFPLKNEFKSDKRYPVPARLKPKFGRSKFLVDCELCGEPESVSKAEVDHIEPAGSLIDFIDLTFFFYRLLCSKKNMRLLHKDCHKIVTLADKKGITVEEAKLEKESIAFSKLSVCKQKKILVNLGFSDKEISNATKRRALYTEHLKGEKK